MARRDHEKFYSIDWKYLPKDRQLPTWPESRESMQDRLDKTLAHVIQSYTSRDKGMERDLSIVFVTHASPVNALIEACIQTPVLVPVGNCSISRCLWMPISETELETQKSGDNWIASELGTDALVQSKDIVTVAGKKGRWHLDYQTYTAHLNRDER
ncbi:hypothetical protein BGZ76_001056 [Entomortierella beljakovae]|nr:hypothetical protein BGZ76_001056 [Entomortierella beljakovae]